MVINGRPHGPRKRTTCQLHMRSFKDGNAIPVKKTCADQSMDVAACIGCGACITAYPNAMLFVSAKISQLALLPQGQPERYSRVRDMVAQMDDEEFGTCTNHGECEAACPKAVNLENIARMNRDFIWSSLTYRPESGGGGGGDLCLSTHRQLARKGQLSIRTQIFSRMRVRLKDSEIQPR